MPKLYKVCQLAFASCILVVSGCDSPTRPIVQAEFRLAAPLFTRVAPGVAEVQFSVVNLGIAPVHITTRCGDQLMPTIERRAGKEWQQYAGGACIAINAMSPIALAGGDQADGSVDIAEAGQYRLVLGTDGGALASATFIIE